jgi:homoserine kinase type II
MTGPPARVLDLLGLRPHEVTLLRDVPSGNGNWLVGTPDGRRLVLRRYRPGATARDLSYEHTVLRHLATAGWTVPDPVGELVDHEGLWFCLTRYVPGQAVRPEPSEQRRRRGRDLARLHLALRDLGHRIGQRPGWRTHHGGITAHADLDWTACVAGLMEVSPWLGSWAHAVATATQNALAAIGADQLPVTVVHGDFAEWNVHYEQGRLTGVIDFGLTHMDSRPYELAIARTYRAPEAVAAYRAELARHDWPLSELEEAALDPVNRAFRVGMAASEMDNGLRTGQYDLTAIERHLSRTGTPPPPTP